MVGPPDYDSFLEATRKGAMGTLNRVKTTILIYQ